MNTSYVHDEGTREERKQRIYTHTHIGTHIHCKIERKYS